jgi:hypothetical protein
VGCTFRDRGSVGELSWLNFVLPRGLFLVPLTRFRGFVALIPAGFALPTAVREVRGRGSIEVHGGG